MGGYGSLEVLGDKFLPKQSRLFDDEAESSECREGGGKTLLSVTQAIRACETCSPPSTPPTHTHKSLVQHCHFFAKRLFLESEPVDQMFENHWCLVETMKASALPSAK